MQSRQLIESALGDIDPWYVDQVTFEEGDSGQELHIYLGLKRGQLFDGKKAHDFQERTWRHLNFFEYRCYLHAKVPRVKTEDGKVETFKVPWSRRNLGFTLKMDAMIMLLLKSDLPINGVARMIGEHPRKVWDVFNYWIRRAYSQEDHSDIKMLGLDETSVKKEHNYITIDLDIENGRVVRCAPGKDKAAVEDIKDYLEQKGSPSDEVEHIAMDMSPAYIAACSDYFPEASITFDRFHVVQIVNKSLDTVRKLERKESELLKGHKYTVLKNPHKLSESKRTELSDLPIQFPKLGEANRLRELLEEFLAFRTIEEETQSKIFLYEWCRACIDSGIKPMQEAANSIMAHWTGITNYTISRLTSGVMESVNRKIQTIRRLSRGFYHVQNFINMIYYKCGKLNFSIPQVLV